MPKKSAKTPKKSAQKTAKSQSEEKGKQASDAEPTAVAAPAAAPPPPKVGAHFSSILCTIAETLGNRSLGFGGRSASKQARLLRGARKAFEAKIAALAISACLGSAADDLVADLRTNACVGVNDAMVETADDGQANASPDDAVVPFVLPAGTSKGAMSVALAIIIVGAALDRGVDSWARLALALPAVQTALSSAPSEAKPGRATAPLIGHLFYMHARWLEHERAAGRGADVTSVAGQRSLLHAARQASALLHEEENAAMLLNELLRSFLLEQQIDPAFRLLSHTPLRADSVSADTLARFLYYKGYVRAMQFEYAEASDCIALALRKAPTRGALGFRLAARQLGVVVELLMGETPERSTFREDDLAPYLVPYLSLARAVRGGDVAAYQRTLTEHEARLTSDALYALTTRLHHTVIRAGLRKIGMSYSRLSIAEVATKLSLPPGENAELLVARAIRDGVLAAEIDHKGGFVKTQIAEDIYSTAEPAAQFDQRIQFCLKVHEDAVKAMRYPDTRDEEARREAERVAREEAEIAAEIEEEDDFL